MEGDLDSNAFGEIWEVGQVACSSTLLQAKSSTGIVRQVYI